SHPSDEPGPRFFTPLRGKSGGRQITPDPRPRSARRQRRRFEMQPHDTRKLICIELDDKFPFTEDLLGVMFDQPDRRLQPVNAFTISHRATVSKKMQLPFRAGLDSMTCTFDCGGCSNQG